ncbi:MAG: STAS domain-containing protein [Planctomycetes bacterium]|nr:STAS domain-containing protein [Planctomycetota bacterium]MBI3845073.1 STAS domain-containing protein [Planctomycetota bacterium]
MKIDKTIMEDVGILSLKGEFDTFECAMFTEEVDSLQALGINKLVLNFRLLRFINSTALGAVVRTKKNLKVRGGDVVIAKPSSFTRNVLNQLGLDQLISVYDEEEEALDHFKAKNTNSVEVDGENVILFQFADPQKALLYGHPYGVGKIDNIEEDGLSFRWERGKKDTKGSDASASELFTPGTEVKAKFRLPFYKKAYYFDIPSQVQRVEDRRAAGATVTLQFKQVSDLDRKSIEQFVSDMRYLKGEARTAASDSKAKPQ